MLYESLAYNNQRYALMSSANVQFAIYSPNCNTNDPKILFINGNSYSVKTRQEEILNSDQSVHKYSSMRISISGVTVHEGNRCCLVQTLVWGSILLFPLFFICCDWWKNKSYRVLSVTTEGYEAVAQLLKRGNFQQLYLTVQDNNFNRSKAEILLDAVLKSGVKNFQFHNTVQGFNTERSNYDDFAQYMKPALQHLDFVEFKWDKTALSNVRIN